MSDSEGEWLSARGPVSNGGPLSQELLSEKFGYKKKSLKELASHVSPKTKKVEAPSVDSPISSQRKRNLVLSSDDEDASLSSGKMPRTFNGKSFDAKDRKPRSSRPQLLSESDSEDGSPLSKLSKDLAAVPLPGPASTKFEATRRAIIASSDGSDNEDEITNTKTLRNVAKKARKHGRGRRMASDDDESSAEEFDEAEAADSYNSSDSDADEHRSKKERILMEKMRARCLRFMNQASETELKCAPNFNERFLQMILSSRPFANYQSLEEKVNELPRGSGLLAQYEEYIENRGILDQVLDDCRKQSEQIQKELEAIQDGLPDQPQSLNPSYTLYDYQKVGLNWLIMMHKLKMNAILADEMGLGKTIQIISFLTYLKDKGDKRKNLVVVPSSTLENWMNEMSTWSPSLRFLTYYGSQQERAQLRSMAKYSDHDLIITTYQMIGSKAEDRQFFKRFDFEYIIYDEAHMLRSCNTQRYQNLLRVRGRRKILLTGTPLQNNLVELISLMYFTMPKMFAQYCEDISSLLRMFATKSGVKCTVRPSESQTDENEDEHYMERKIEQAKQILQPFVLRRLKATVLENLPKKNEKVQFCEMTDTQRGIYKFVTDDIRQQQENDEGQNPAGGLMRMRQAANHPLLHRRHYEDDQLEKMAKILCNRENHYKKQKPDYVAEDLSYMSDIAIHQLCCKYDCIRSFRLDHSLAMDSGKCRQLDTILSSIKEKGEKAVLFSQFTSMLDVLELYLSVHQYKFCRLDGSTPVMERQELINAFNADPSIFVFLLSTKAGGLGINLTAANHIIIHDIDFNPYNDKQAEDRCHRMGQKKEVMVTRLISKGTVEEAMLELAKKKLELEKNVTSGNAADDDRLDSKTTEFLLMQAVRKHCA